MRGAGRQKICDALCVLAEDRPVSKVTVSELIAVAGVNRSTFYYYFDSTQDVLEKMISDFSGSYLRLLALPPGRTAKTLESDRQMEMERGLCDYVASKAHYIRFFLREQNYQAFKRQFQAQFYAYCDGHRVVQLCQDGGPRLLKQGIVYDYFLRILFSQILGILEFWAERDFSEEPADFIHIFNTIRTTGITLQG